jgi:CxxC-x17-CxxC domain-containing protein
MGDYNQDNRFGGGRGGSRYGGRDSGRRSFGDRDSVRTMHKATCASCGSECEVPFRPSGERPVYCSNCFRKRNNDEGGSGESDRRPRFEQRRTSSPSEGSGNAGAQINGQIAEQLKSLNFKLDKIISFLEPKVVETKISEAKSEVPQVLEPKVKKPKAPKKKAPEEK